jgi:hypothetical protein
VGLTRARHGGNAHFVVGVVEDFLLMGARDEVSHQSSVVSWQSGGFSRLGRNSMGVHARAVIGRKKHPLNRINLQGGYFALKHFSVFNRLILPCYLAR